MTNQVADKNAIKAHLPELLEEMGINPRKHFKCLNPEHDDSNPSMSYNRQKMNVHCFSCGSTYDIFDLIGLQYNLTDTKEAFKKAFELYGDKPVQSYKDTTPKAEVDYTEYIIRCHQQIHLTDYPSIRGLSHKSIENFKLGYDDDFIVREGSTSKQWSALIIPTSITSFLARNTNPNANKAERIRKHGESKFFNLKALKQSQPVFIVEGEIDAMSIYECGHQAVALGSIANIYKFVNYLKQNRPTQRIILSLDNDTEGHKAQVDLQKALLMNNIETETADITLGHKDANEALRADRQGFQRVLDDTVNDDPLKAQKEAYQANRASHFIADFIQGVKASANTKAISTKFKQLDDVLGGGLYEGLYIIGAVASLGKTTFILQVADQIAQSGQDVMIFSLEMSKHELVAKSISRLTFKYTQEKNIDSSNAKTIRGITNGDAYKNYSTKEQEVIRGAIDKYKAYADHLYLFEGMADMGVKMIHDRVKEHIELTGNRPVVIIDYLQILEPCSDRLSDKQNIDKSTTELKRMSREHKIPVIVISSFNRSSYSSTVSMESFKESGAIEYSSDVLMGMQLTKMEGNSTADDINEYKKADTRDITLRVLKNRSGMIGDVKFGYKTLFSHFYEVSEVKK